MNGKLSIVFLNGVLISSFVLPVLANENIAAVNSNSINYVVNITPSDLVNSSYQGQFNNVGIPGYYKLSNGVQTGKINAQYLVEKAIESGRLEPKTISDRNYLSQVQFFINNLDRD